MNLLKLITKKTLKHSSRGNFIYENRKPKLMTGGGHAQENMHYLSKNKLKYGIDKEFSNGVRLGNVKDHVYANRQRNSGHAWFPKTWTAKDIEDAGCHVRRLKKNRNPQNNTIYIGRYKGVTVGIYCKNGKISTIFPYFKINEGAKKKAYVKFNKATK